MLKNHIIVGNGKWAKKILFFLKKYKVAEQIVVISKKKKFIFYPKYKKLDKWEFKKYLNKSQTAHICSSTKTHLKYCNYFLKLNIKFIVEKPLVNSSKEFKKIKFINKSKYLVNYIDLFNYDFDKINRILNKYKNEKINLDIVYSNNFKKYKIKNQIFKEWLDHPLSIILFTKKKYTSFKIRNLEINKDRKARYTENLEVEYKFKKIKIKFLITNSLKKQRLIKIQTLNKKYYFNLGKNINFKKSSFYRLYRNLKYIDNSKFKFCSTFHQKVLIEKEKILNLINK